MFLKLCARLWNDGENCYHLFCYNNADLKKFYEKQEWYIPNPNYEPDVSTLTEIEEQWINKWQ